MNPNVNSYSLDSMIWLPRLPQNMKICLSIRSQQTRVKKWFCASIPSTDTPSFLQPLSKSLRPIWYRQWSSRSLNGEDQVEIGSVDFSKDLAVFFLDSVLFRTAPLFWSIFIVVNGLVVLFMDLMESVHPCGTNPKMNRKNKIETFLITTFADSSECLRESFE